MSVKQRINRDIGRNKAPTEREDIKKAMAVRQRRKRR
jgi:hypothetical protein